MYVCLCVYWSFLFEELDMKQIYAEKLNCRNSRKCKQLKVEESLKIEDGGTMKDEEGRKNAD